VAYPTNIIIIFLREKKMILFHKFLFLYKSKYRRKWVGNGPPAALGRHGGALNFSTLSTTSSVICIALFDILLSLLVIVNPVSVQSTSSQTQCGGIISSSDNSSSSVSVPCVNGYCDNNTNLCVCHPGWTGSECQFCHGKVK
jgi:hypothetical protein